MSANNLFSWRQWRPLLLVASLGLLVLAAVSPAEAKPPKGGGGGGGSGGGVAYTVVPLGFPANALSSEAWAINDYGWTAGTFTDNSGVNHVFLVIPLDTDADGKPDTWFQDADGDGANDLMLDIVARHNNDRPLINNLGQIAACRDGAAGALKPFLWDPMSGFRDIDVLDGYTSLELWAMNDLGQVVGTATGGGLHAQAFFWDPDLGTIGLGTLGGTVSNALGINNMGQVVGAAYDAFNQNHAFLWDPVGGMRDLFPGRGSYATAINDAGEVAGGTADLDPTGGYVWSDLDGDLVADPDEIIALDNPNGLWASPYAINDRGQTVGAFDYVERRLGWVERKPALWQPDGSLVDLEKRSTGANGTSWGIAPTSAVSDINNDGVIPTTGSQKQGPNYGPEQAVVLVPNN